LCTSRAAFLQVQRKTKIIATLGPSCSDADIITRMVAAGMDALRINAAFSDHAAHSSMIAAYRAACAAAGKQPCVCVDLQGSELRSSWLVDKASKAPVDGMQLTAGQKVVLFGSATQEQDSFVGWDDGDNTRIGIGLAQLGEHVKQGFTIRMADGSVEFRVLEVLSASEARAQVVSDCKLGSHKMVSLANTELALPFLSAKDVADVEWAVAEGVDCLITSYARSKDDMDELLQLLQRLDASVHMQCALNADPVVLTVA
jgi:pyruvate kinase